MHLHSPNQLCSWASVPSASPLFPPSAQLLAAPVAVLLGRTAEDPHCTLLQIRIISASKIWLKK